MTETVLIFRDGEMMEVDAATFRAAQLGPLSEAKANLIQSIKAEAGRRITAILPAHAQLNAIRAGTHADEFTRIDAIRAYSDALEAEVNSKRQHNTLAAIDLKVGWPD